jgi:hypothetical protein
MAPESYHERNSEVRVAAIRLVRRVEGVDPPSSDDTTAKPFAQNQIARSTTRLADAIFWEVQTQSRSGFPQRFPGLFHVGGRHRPLK